jgi:hypothetical protein
MNKQQIAILAGLAILVLCTLSVLGWLVLGPLSVPAQPSVPQLEATMPIPATATSVSQPTTNDSSSPLTNYCEEFTSAQTGGSLPQIIQAMGDYNKGLLSKDVYLAKLDDAITVFRGRAERLKAIIPPDSEREAHTRSIKGYELFANGLEEMKLGISAGDNDRITRGGELQQQGITLINDAFSLIHCE